MSSAEQHASLMRVSGMQVLHISIRLTESQEQQRTSTPARLHLGLSVGCLADLLDFLALEATQISLPYAHSFQQSANFCICLFAQEWQQYQLQGEVETDLARR